MVRHSRPGTSIASDHQGRLLAHKSDYFVGADHTMAANMPTSGGRTLYVLIGECVSWLCVLAAPALVGLVCAPEHRQQRLKAAHQVGSPMQTKLT